MVYTFPNFEGKRGYVVVQSRVLIGNRLLLQNKKIQGWVSPPPPHPGGNYYTICLGSWLAFSSLIGGGIRRSKRMSRWRGRRRPGSSVGSSASGSGFLCGLTWTEIWNWKLEAFLWMTIEWCWWSGYYHSHVFIVRQAVMARPTAIKSLHEGLVRTLVTSTNRI